MNSDDRENVHFEKVSEIFRRNTRNAEVQKYRETGTYVDWTGRTITDQEEINRRIKEVE